MAAWLPQHRHGVGPGNRRPQLSWVNACMRSARSGRRRQLHGPRARQYKMPIGSSASQARLAHPSRHAQALHQPSAGATSRRGPQEPSLRSPTQPRRSAGAGSPAIPLASAPRACRAAAMKLPGLALLLLGLLAVHSAGTGGDRRSPAGAGTCAGLQRPQGCPTEA